MYETTKDQMRDILKNLLIFDYYKDLYIKQILIPIHFYDRFFYQLNCNMKLPFTIWAFW